ncbi:hypothetical protein Taro_041042 [Colocasia esculenta]|uniref:Late embryogenesis abundant protein LEA-2 subgroup domain-containing protein n=1 Tax=Colocasia esculenta TaxID=4460 RepID=A0A843WAG4_COLES|nr:hypothetical protein [Colocasia esculenta]
MEQEPKPVVTGYPAAAQPPSYPAGAGAPAHGTAYPYQAPPYYPAPPPPPPGPYYQPPNNAYGGNTTFLRRLIIITIAVFLIVGFATFIAWLVLRPRIPVFAVTSATVSSFNVSVGSQQMSAEFNLSVSVRNPNKRVGLSYDELDAAVLYRSTLISETSLAPFYQEKGDSRVLPARFSAVGRYVGGDVANGIAGERSSNGGAVVFHVRFFGRVNFRSGAWRTRRHYMRVYCDNVKFVFGNATASVGTFTGSPQQCEVHI